MLPIRTHVLSKKRPRRKNHRGLRGSGMLFGICWSMKHLHLFFLWVALSYSCIGYKPYQTFEENTPVPIRPSGTRAELYFEGDRFPNKPHVIGGTVMVTERKPVTTQQLSGRLKATANKLGYDAVVDIQKDNFSDEGVTFGDFVSALDGEVTTSTIYYSSLSGTGIKFIENINYLHEIVKTQVAHLVEGDSKEHLFTKTFFHSGEFDSIRFENDQAKVWHDDLIQATDLQRLLFAERGWQYRKDDLGRIKWRKRQRFDDWALEEVKIKYHKATATIKNIEVMKPISPGTRFKIANIKPHYEEGKIVRKEIHHHTLGSWTEDLYYEEGIHTASIYTDMANPDAQIWVVYGFFEKEDFPILAGGE